MRICKKCGNILPYASDYCRECDRPIEKPMSDIDKIKGDIQKEIRKIEGLKTTYARIMYVGGLEMALDIIKRY